MTEMKIQCDNLWYFCSFLSVIDSVNFFHRIKSRPLPPSLPPNSYEKPNAPSAVKTWSTTGNDLSTSAPKNVTSNSYPLNPITLT
jgi:hypothetical protein